MVHGGLLVALARPREPQFADARPPLVESLWSPILLEEFPLETVPPSTPGTPESVREASAATALDEARPTSSPTPKGTLFLYVPPASPAQTAHPAWAHGAALDSPEGASSLPLRAPGPGATAEARTATVAGHLAAPGAVESPRDAGPRPLFATMSLRGMLVALSAQEGALDGAEGMYVVRYDSHADGEADVTASPADALGARLARLVRAFLERARAVPGGAVRGELRVALGHQAVPDARFTITCRDDAHEGSVQFTTGRFARVEDVPARH